MPERTCIGCRRRAPAADLVRVAWSSAEGRLLVGAGPNGRGAWLCRSADCIDSAMRRRAFGRALRADVPPEAVEALLSGGFGDSLRPLAGG